MHPITLTHRAAFTLVEVAIVLVIMGLLISGVLVGQTMIHAAQLRSVSTQFEQYKTALGTFKDTYLGLPGDLKNAVRYWGAAAGGTDNGVDSTCAALTSASPATGTETCNGDGDGMIYAYPAPPDAHEAFRSWQQLANAGLIEGPFTGVPGPAATKDMIPGSNIPSAKIGGGWTFAGLGYFALSGTPIYEGEYGNTLILGNRIPTVEPIAPLLSSLDAYDLDSKLDDGLPQSGKVMSFKSAAFPNCIVGTDDAYLTTDSTDAACVLIFHTGY